jgi:hypothetical protein
MSSLAGESAADPLEAFLAELERLSVDDLAMVALPEPDPEERTALLQKAVDAAHAADRREGLAVAPARAREKLFRAYAFRAYEPTWFGLNWGRSLGRADDRARLVAAVEDAAVAAAVGDLLTEEDVAALREPFELAASMAGAAPAANPIIRGTGVRRAVLVTALVVGVTGTLLTGYAAVIGLFAVLGGLLTRRRRAPRADGQPGSG